MALLHMAPIGDHHSATQESMFEEPTELHGQHPVEVVYDASDDASEDISAEPSYEASEEFSAEALESVSDEPANESVTGPIEITHAREAASQATAGQAQSVPSPSAAAEPESEQVTVLSVDDFAALEDRVLRAVSLVRNERQARAMAEERSVVLENQLQAQLPVVDRLQQEVDSLRIEREQVRQRVERLLSQLDALEL